MSLAQTIWRRILWRVFMARAAARRWLRPLTFAGQWLGGMAVLGVFALLRRLDPDRASDAGGGLARRLGPFLPVHRTGLANLRAAFPDKDKAWIDATLLEAWDNLGRVAGEYVHLAHFWDFGTRSPGRIDIAPEDEALFQDLLNDGKPALCFSAHLGNWELSALVPPSHGMDSAVVYRVPNNPIVAREIQRIRAASMGQMIRTRGQAPIEIAAALHAGKHVGMLADQHFSRGVDIRFFGRACKGNPAIARLARQIECPVVGVRVIRLPHGRFRVQGVGPLTLPRAPDGRIDVPGTTQMINDIIEGWVREYPGQWLWFHRRWR